MKSDLEPESSGPAGFAWPATEEFAEWLKADPANLEQWSEIVKQLVAGGGGALPPDVLAKIVARIPVGRLGQASEIARAVLFLVADEGGFITGSTLSINGGQHMY